MHAEAVVDLVETENREVQFRQVQGDFSVLQGKFMLQEGTPEVSMLAPCPGKADRNSLRCRVLQLQLLTAETVRGVFPCPFRNRVVPPYSHISDICSLLVMSYDLVNRSGEPSVPCL